MAFSVRIKGIDRTSERVTLNMEPPWWSPQELIGDERFIETNEGGYLDYDADVSLEEMIAIHEMFVPAATSKQDGWMRSMAEDHSAHVARANGSTLYIWRFVFALPYHRF